MAVRSSLRTTSQTERRTQTGCRMLASVTLLQAKNSPCCSSPLFLTSSQGNGNIDIPILVPRRLELFKITALSSEQRLSSQLGYRIPSNGNVLRSVQTVRKRRPQLSETRTSLAGSCPAVVNWKRFSLIERFLYFNPSSRSSAST